MNKQRSILIIFLGLGVVLFIGYQGFGWENIFNSSQIGTIARTVAVSDSDKDRAWSIFERYLEYARTHNLAGVKSISHQLSATCQDQTKEAECFSLMDSVYSIGSMLDSSQFKHIQADERQIIMYTDGPTVAIMYFTRDGSGDPKILGMRFCLTEGESPDSCVETDPRLRDLDGNGWWDSVESLFYPDA